MADEEHLSDLQAQLRQLHARTARAEERVARLEAALAQAQARPAVVDVVRAGPSSRAGFLAGLGLGAAALAAETVLVTRATEPQRPLPVYNVQTYGARGTGTTDDTPALNQAIAAAARTGGIVELPAGIYQVAPHPHPQDPTYAVCVLMRGGVILRGAGVGATTIRLAPHAALPAPSRHISLLLNATINPRAAQLAPDTAMGIEDLTLDGTAPTQDALTHGLVWIRCRAVQHTRVRVRNVYGTAPSGPAETVGFEFQLGAQATYTECEAVTTDGGPSATGFSADRATDLSYVSCLAHGQTVGQGFTHYGCAVLRYLNCYAHGNGGYGFNSEVSEDVRYATCVAGGRADGGGEGPYAAHQPLGNGAAGFFVRGSTVVDLLGCASRFNAGHGLWIAHQAEGVRVVGGAYAANGGWGIAVAAEARGVAISHETALAGNGLGAVQAQADVNAATPFVFDSGWRQAGAAPIALAHGLPDRPRWVTVYGGTAGIPTAEVGVPLYAGAVLASSTHLWAPELPQGQYYRVIALY